MTFFLLRLINTFDFVGEFANRTVGTQGGHQAAGICVSLVFGIGGGAIVGEFVHCFVQWCPTQKYDYLVM